LPQEQIQQDASSIHEENTENITLQKGKPEGFYITNHYCVPNTGLDYTSILVNATEARDTDSTDGYAYYGITVDDVDRLNVQMMNVSLPIALMILDPDKYRSLSRARKDCRKGYILIHRGPLVQNNTVDSTIEPFFEQDKLIRGRVGDRIFPGDVIAYQVRMSGGFYPNAGILKPSFDVPVVYEDDHFAIVNKPAGVVVYSHRNGGHGRMTMTSALPWVLRPPKMGTVAIVRKPSPVHRLDKPTSGLLVVAKTKPAMINLSEQFRIRRVRKTYVAIVNGIPNEPAETRITSQEAYEMGVDVDMNILNDDCGGENSFTTNSTEQKFSSWQLVDTMLDDKSAVTIWRPLKYVKSLKAKDGVLTLVELKPKTGRYHQLRRHMAWVKECPLVGDSIYDGGGEAMNLRRRGLFLCSNQVRLDHPYYNTDIGRKEWEALPEHEKWANGKIKLVKDLDGKETIEVLVKIDLPEKFESFLLNEGERYRKLE
jgi:23S rRNA-/tRNA-specific pseudouridylate synthase